MNAADFNGLTESEKKHFYKCRCGEMVDKRQLDDVLFHEDHIHKPDIRYGDSLRVEELNTQRFISLTRRFGECSPV
jgi:hypothetical protein